MSIKQDALNGLSSLATNAMGAARVAGEEVKTATQSRARDLMNGLDMADKDALEAVKELAITALERLDSLEARIAELENK